MKIKIKNLFYLATLLSIFPSVVIAQESSPSPVISPTSNDQFEEILEPEDSAEDEVKIEKDLAHEAKLQDLLRGLSSPDERTRIESGMELKKIVKLGDTNVLGQTLKRGNNLDKQLFIIDSLAKLGDKRSGEALRFETRHGELESQRAATSALGKIQSDWPIPVLVRTLRQEKDDELRKRAASSLGELGSTQAVYAIRTSLAKLEDSPAARNAAFYALDYALGEIDPQRIDTNFPAGMRLTNYYKGMKYFFYHPSIRKNASALKSGLRPWLLVCIHDGDLAASDVFTVCWRAAKKRQMAVLVPTFDAIKYPDFGAFNMRGERSDLKLLELIEFLNKQVSLSVREMYMFGYGTGGDFVQRFVMTHPKRIARAAFESLNFTKPDPEYLFPKGLGSNPLAMDLSVDMYSVLKTDLMLIHRKESPNYKDSKIFAEAFQDYADVNGIRARLATKTVDVKFEIWNEAEKFLFGYDYMN